MLSDRLFARLSLGIVFAALGASFALAVAVVKADEPRRAPSPPIVGVGAGR